MGGIGYDDIHVPPFRQSDLNETASRYDNILAAASDSDLRLMWFGWGFIALTVATFCSTVLLAMLLTPEVRRSPFNLYLIYLLIPDIVLAASCAATCFLNLIAGEYLSTPLCRYQSFYIVWGIGANSWVNVAIARELHKMLRHSNHRQRYFPPTQRQVTLQAAAIYVATAAVPLLEYIPGIPLETAAQFGAACIPVQYDLASTIFFYAVFLPLFALIPLVWVSCIAISVWRSGILPVSGRSRNLAVYFARVIVCFVLMWLPSVALFFMGGGNVSPWIQWFGGIWGHVQGAVSGVIALCKPDIAKAFRGFLHCRFIGVPDEWQVGFASSSRLHLTRTSSNAKSTSSSIASSRFVKDAGDETSPSGGDQSVDDDGFCIRGDEGEDTPPRHSTELGEEAIPRLDDFEKCIQDNADGTKDSLGRIPVEPQDGEEDV